jgi:hypothetical protein
MAAVFETIELRLNRSAIDFLSSAPHDDAVFLWPMKNSIEWAMS